MKRGIVFLTLILIFITAGCSRPDNNRFDFKNVKSYKDIPGVTEEEINQIEAIKAAWDNLTYGQLYKTVESESLYDSNTSLNNSICELLSELFEIDFIPYKCDTWGALKSGIDSLEIDFSGAFTPTPERMEIYYMTTHIIGYSFIIYTRTDAKPIQTESDLNGFKIGFVKDTVLADQIADSYPDLSFTLVEYDTLEDGVELLKTGEIDCFVIETSIDAYIEQSDLITSRDFFKLAYSPVAITTANPEFKPIITVLNKYLAAGGIDKFHEFYIEGYREYQKQKLQASFTAEEKAYIDEFSTQNKKVKIAYEHDNYPVSFYNTADGEFQGMVPDIINEISNLLDMEFENVTDKDTPWVDIYEKLESGEIALVGELLYSESRHNHFIWSEIAYTNSHYAILSKAEQPSMTLSQVAGHSIGVVEKTGHEDIFLKYFSNHLNITRYKTQNDALDALENGEIDLLMGTEHMILIQANYREKTGFKVNVRLSVPMGSYFGFNKNEAVLKSIIDKVMPYVDTYVISGNWTDRTFDYTKKISTLQSIYLSAFSGVLMLVLITLAFMYVKNKKLNDNLIERTTMLSAIYQSIPDLVFTKDVNGVFTSCNKSFEEYAGKPASQIIGYTDSEVFNIHNSEKAKSFMESDKRVIDSRSKLILEETITYPDGKVKHIETIKAPIFQNERLIGVLGICRDITERKEFSSQHNIIINTAQIAFLSTENSVISTINDYGKKILGLNVGDRIESFYEDPNLRHEIFNTLINKNNPSFNSIIKGRNADGEIHRFRVNISQMEFSNRKSNILWALDIENDEKKNDQIRSAHKNLQTILDTLPLPVAISSRGLPNNHFIYGNNSFIQLMELKSREDVSSLSEISVLDPIQADSSTPEEISAFFKSSTTTLEREINLLTVNKRKVEARMYATPIDFYGEDVLLGILVDLEKEKEYLRMQQSLQTILDMLPIPIRIIDTTKLTFLYINNAAMELIGTSSQEEVIGKSIFNFMPEKQANGALSVDIIKGIKLTQEPQSGEYICKRANGELVETLITSCLINYQGKKSSLAIIEDLTQQREYQRMLSDTAQKERDANQLKSRFLVNMSHEIRTPMNAIIGLTEIELRKEDLREDKDTYKKINASAKNLLSIINDILDLSKIEADKIELYNEEFELEEVLNSAQLVVSPRLDGKNVEFLLNLALDLPRFVVGDRTRLWQILKNFLDNSAKFTENGKIVLSVTNNRERSSADIVTITFVIQDTGIGVDETQIKKMFEPYEQIKNEAQKKYSGTGLGMAISKQLCELMGGELHLISKIGEGTLITMNIPFKRSDSNNSKLLESVVNSSLSGLNVLAVDDDELSLDIMSRLLENNNVQYVLARSGSEAIDLIIQNRDMGRVFDLILLDYMMNGLNGMETARQIQMTLSKAPKLLMVTAFQELILKNELKENGIDGIIEKPFIPSQFINKLCRVLGVNGKVVEPKQHVMKFKDVRILICEDYPLNQEVVEGMLESFDITADMADDGQQGVEMLYKDSNYDLIFMDIQMPVMDGYEATQIIRSDSRFDNIPIVSLTADAMKEIVDRCIEIGMNDHISKPIEFESLNRVLLKWLPENKRVTDDYVSEIEEANEKLIRFGGDVARYEKALLSFTDLLPEKWPSFENILETTEEAKYNIHKLKGAAGLVSEKQIYDCASRFESTLRAGRQDKTLYIQLVDASNEARARIIKQLGNKSSAYNPPGTENEFAEIMAKLKDALLYHNPKTSFELSNALKENSWPFMSEADEHNLLRLFEYIRRYEFEDALDIFKLMTATNQE